MAKEQVSTLGNVRFKPMQRDMFTGNLVKTKPRAGRGDHILLKQEPGERPAIPGMAFFAGTGPEGKRCQHCRFCMDIPTWGRQKFTSPARAGRLPSEPPRVIENACTKAADMLDGKAQPGDIQFNPACKYFEPKP